MLVCCRVLPEADTRLLYSKTFSVLTSLLLLRKKSEKKKMSRNLEHRGRLGHIASFVFINFCKWLFNTALFSQLHFLTVSFFSHFYRKETEVSEVGASFHEAQNSPCYSPDPITPSPFRSESVSLPVLPSLNYAIISRIVVLRYFCDFGSTRWSRNRYIHNSPLDCS
jgi:hypothetical protein